MRGPQIKAQKPPWFGSLPAMGTRLTCIYYKRQLERNEPACQKVLVEPRFHRYG